MADEILLKKEEIPSEKPAGIAMETEDGQTECSMPGKGWFKGPLGMAVCCGAPLVLVGALSVLGLSWGTIASGSLKIIALLVCPVVMLLMMRYMNK